MFHFIEKRWPLISLLLVGLLICALLFFPYVSGLAAGGVTILCVGLAIAFAARPRLDAYRQQQITRRELVRLLAIDLLGITLAMGAAILVGALAGRPAGSAAAQAMESAWPGHGAQIGMLAGVLVALLAGIGAGLLIHKLWGKLRNRKSPAVR